MNPKVTLEQKKILWIYVGLVTVILVIQLSLHFLPRIIAKSAEGAALEGKWNYCWQLSSSPTKKCEWKVTTFPGSIPKIKEKPGAVLHLQKSFVKPPFCDFNQNACALLIGTVSDPAEFFLNNTRIGNIGQPGLKKAYTQTFPFTLSTLSSALREENSIDIILHPNYSGNQGLIRGPIHLFPVTTASWVSRIIIAQTVTLPLISGIIMLVLFVVTLLICTYCSIADEKVHSFLGYCLTMGLYLVSLTRLPREILSPQLGIAIHFALRVATEYFHFGLVTSLFDRKIIWVEWARRYCIILLFFLLVPALLEPIGINLDLIQSIGRTLYRWNVGLFIIPPLLCLYLIRKISDIERRQYFPLAVLYMIVCLMVLSDCLAINGLIEDIYFVRFYPLLLALGYCSGLWSSYSRLREQNQKKILFGEISAQVAHDIRSPLTFLSVIAEDLNGISHPREKLFRTAVEKINTIANDLLQQRRSPQKNSVQEQTEERKISDISILLRHAIQEKNVGLKLINIKLALCPSAQGCVCDLHPIQFERVISNLLENAVVASSVNEELLVNVKAIENTTLEIKIIDQGKGIPTEILKILNSDSPRSFGKSNGNGLGLSHAKEWIKSWGGVIQLNSQLGKGTTVTVRLPILHREMPTENGEYFPNQPDISSVLIDDRKEQRFDWWLNKKSKGEVVRVFDSLESFLNESEYFPTTMPIWVGPNLRSSIPKIRIEGFETIEFFS